MCQLQTLQRNRANKLLNWLWVRKNQKSNQRKKMHKSGRDLSQRMSLLTETKKKWQKLKLKPNLRRKEVKSIKKIMISLKEHTTIPIDRKASPIRKNLISLSKAIIQKKLRRKNQESNLKIMHTTHLCLMIVMRTRNESYQLDGDFK